MEEKNVKNLLIVSIVANVLLLGALVFGFASQEDFDVRDDDGGVASDYDTIKNDIATPSKPSTEQPAPSVSVPTPAPVPTPTPTPASKPTVSAATLPLDIHMGQITKIIENTYALVSRRSMNMALSDVPANFDTKFGGVLIWDETKGKWVKFLSVTDVNPADKNNPIDMWFEAPGGPSRILYLRVKDQNGAGSGEGVVKTLTPKNVEMSAWSIVQCYYHADDTGDGAPIKKTNKECQNAIITVVDGL